MDPQEIDNLAANNFYNTQVTESGRGRFPGQTKFDKNVPENGGYGNATDQSGASITVDAELNADLVGVPGSSDPAFFTYSAAAGSKWVSVFGTTNTDLSIPTPNYVNTSEDPVAYPDAGNYTMTVSNGGEEFLELFGGDAIKSPFQDGHYIYTVIGGSGSGSQSVPPIIYVADLESPSSFFKKLQP